VKGNFIKTWFNLFFIMILAIGLIPGCSAKDEPASDEDKITGPTDAEVQAAYQKADEAYGWFYLSTLPVDYSDKREWNGYEYFRVEHPTIKTLADLKNYLQTVFSDEIVETLLNEDEDAALVLYRDFDNVLYAIPADAGRDITKGDKTYEIIRESDSKIIFRVNVEIYGDPDTKNVVDIKQYDFPYEYVNGRWVFTFFELI